MFFVQRTENPSVMNSEVHLLLGQKQHMVLHNNTRLIDCTQSNIRRTQQWLLLMMNKWTQLGEQTPALVYEDFYVMLQFFFIVGLVI